MSPMAAAYGRAARIASSARRMRAPATIFIARVICCVLRSERTRSRSWRRVATSEALLEFDDGRVKRGLRLSGKFFAFGDGLWDLGMRRLQELVELAMELRDPFVGYVGEIVVDGDVELQDLLFERERVELRLFQGLRDLLAARELRLRGLVQIRSQL